MKSHIKYFKPGLAFLPMAVLIVMGLIFWRGLSLNPALLPSAKLGQPLPSFRLPSLYQNEVYRSSQELIGKPFLLHIWASWCDTCAKEQMHLLKLSHDEQLPIIGLNYKDDGDAAMAWLNLWGNPFKDILVDAQGKAAIELGVYGTPETFLIDANGIIQYRHVGALTPEVWYQTIQPHWKRIT